MRKSECPSGSSGVLEPEAVLGDPVVGRLIDLEARRFGRSADRRGDEGDDQRQLLATGLLLRLSRPRPCPIVSIRAWAKPVLRSVRLDYERAGNRRKRRAPRAVLSLDGIVNKGGREWPVAELAQSSTSSPLEQVIDLEHRDAIGQVLLELPAHLQELCELLAAGSLQQARQQLGFGRRRFDACLEELRARFAAAGLAPENRQRARRDSVDVVPQR